MKWSPSEFVVVVLKDMLLKPCYTIDLSENWVVIGISVRNVNRIARLRFSILTNPVLKMEVNTVALCYLLALLSLSVLFNQS